MNMSVEDVLHLLENNQEFALKNEFKNFNVSYTLIDTEGLDEDDIAELNRFIEFIRNKKKKEINN